MSNRGAVQRLAFACLFISALAVGACASPATGRASATLAPRATATASGPTPTVIVPTPGDVSVCDVIAPAEFARVTGSSATEITSGTTADPLTGLAEVYCIYADASDPHTFLARGTVNYEFAGDATTAGSIFARVKQAFSGVHDVPGVGDSAFSGTPGGTPAGSGFGLLVLRGKLLLYLSVSGDEQTVVRVTRSLATLVLSRVA
jgi:hypothetical protein